MLQLRNITKDYYVGDQVINALQGISVDLRKNEFISVLGPSGCGKTTLMNIVGGLDKYTDGDLIINGKSTADFTSAEWDNYRNKKIGFIFQSYNLIPHLSVLGNVELALTISGISKEERRSRAREALREVGLSDRERQRPNQLSGGQMQRVAIARALINRPEILLADEPTGALDSETSEQIMALIKEIARDRLVIMVTHNPELAERYSNRILHMMDGKITSDSRPYSAHSDMAFIQAEEQARAAETLDGGRRKRMSAMSFSTALSLSGRNLVTKKGRTILTSIAGSIGIIGIALIMALSSGMNNYVSQLQSDMLSSTPISVSATTIDRTQIMNAMEGQAILPEFPAIQKVLVEKTMSMADMVTKNNITEGYVDYVKSELDPKWYNDIVYTTGLEVGFFGIKPGQTVYSELTSGSSGSGGMGGLFSSGSPWQLMQKSDFLLTQYDELDGHIPSNRNEVALIVSSTNQISESTLISLGLKNVGDGVTEYNFYDVLGKEYKVVKNDLLYTDTGSGFQKNLIPDINFAAAETVKISGILRIKESASGGALSGGIGYTQELYDWLQTINEDSSIIRFMKENPLTNPLTGTVYIPEQIGETAADLREADFRAFGGHLIPNSINIYPVSYETKESIKTVLNAYNTGKAKNQMVTYIDLAEMLGDSITTIIDVITWVLIGFTAISLVVSSIMIAIITYVSVLERTKEIGILRSIGARKKDVTRVFNAETFIIGLVAGLIGVIFTYLISIPINLLIKAFLGVTGIASLNIGVAAILILLSIVLTVVSGLIPARKAAKQNPVTALRTE